MWDMLMNEDETMIAHSVRDYLASELPIERLRPRAVPVDLAAVRQGMVGLGWFGVGLPEQIGGGGLGLVEEMLVQRECGRYLVSPSVLATVVAAHVAFHAGDTDLASSLIAGRASAAPAILVASNATEASPAFALDWNEGDLLLVWNDKGMGLFESTALTDRMPDQCLDESVTMHAGRLAMGHATHWISTEQAPLALRTHVLLAAALTGLAEHACDLTVEYAKVREQFGKPIGVFQAVKHRCADMAVRARLSWYQTSLASLKVDAGARDAALQASAAKLVAAQAAHENARAAIQLHGGIGFQVECDVHWFMKRAHLYDQVGGAMQEQARRVVAEHSPVR